jgi:uncharacterized protein (TIGR02145 family)
VVNLTGFSNKAFCYHKNNPSNADLYGVLYTWAAAMNGTPGSNDNPSGVQGVCPTGWHLPSNSEWEDLAIFISEDNGGYSKPDVFTWLSVGGHLKTTTGYYSGGNGTDDYGFSANPHSQRNPYGYFGDVERGAAYWNATEGDDLTAFTRSTGWDGNHLWSGAARKDKGHAARCVKD